MAPTTPTHTNGYRHRPAISGRGTMTARQKERLLARMGQRQGRPTTVAAQPTPAPRTGSTSEGPGEKTQRRRRAAVGGWVTAHKRALAVSVAMLLVVTVVIAAVLIRQDVTVNPSAQAPEVVFAQGADYAAINAAGFATLTLGSSATSASLDMEGVPGAAVVSLADVLALTNTEPGGGQDYDIVLTRSAVPDAAITAFVVNVYDSVDTLIVSWDAVAAASSATFSLPAATTYDITIAPTIADGTAAGGLAAFDMQFALTPA